MEYAYDVAAAAVQPLLETLNEARAHAARDLRANGSRTSGADFAARVRDDAGFADLAARIYEVFCNSSGVLIGCIEDHIRLELLIDPDVASTDILLPNEIVEAVPEEKRAAFPRRLLIDRTIAAFSESNGEDEDQTNTQEAQ